MTELARLDRDSDHYRFLRTQLVRQRNRVHEALLEAEETVGSLAVEVKE